MTRTCPLRGACRTPKSSFSGAVHPAVLVALFGLFFSAASYLYAINRSAVQGYETKRLEREIASHEKENTRLHIVEAELRSLARIETSVKEREMIPVEHDIQLLGAHGSIALR